MARTAVISDIHSNWEALRAVWARIMELDCDEFFCLGDIVGYGARPVECLNHLIEFGATCIQGNHDALVADGSLGLNFNEHSLKAVEHNRLLLNSQHLEFLNALPTRLEPQPGVILAHGSPDDRDRYLLYRQDFRQVSAALYRDGGPGLCFFGHTHVTMSFDGDGFISKDKTKVLVDKLDMMLFNPGSVGQPRDGDPRASFLYWDKEENTINFERVEYDVEKTREEILAAGLPERLGDRLRAGR